MKKFIAIMLCLATLVSAIVLSTSAAKNYNIAVVLGEYGLKPTYAPASTSSAPVTDGVVNGGEYTYVRSFTNRSDSYVGKTFNTYSENYNFGGNCWPNNNVTVKEYVAQDANNIYLAFEFGQDLKNFYFRFNPSQEAIYDCASSKHAQELRYDLPEGVDRDTTASVRWKEQYTVTGQTEFRLLTNAEYHGIAQRNFDEDGDFLNITAEFRFSKSGILNSTTANDNSVKIFSYYCKGARVEAGAGCSEDYDVTLQWTVPKEALYDEGYSSVSQFLSFFYNTSSIEYCSSRAWQMFRFVCFYSDPDDPASTTTTYHYHTTAEPTTAAATTTEPWYTTTYWYTTAEPTTAVATTTEPWYTTTYWYTTAEPTTAVATTAEPWYTTTYPWHTTAEPTAVELTTAEFTTAETTRKKNPSSVIVDTGDPAYRPNTTTTEQTTEQTTVPEADSCHNSLSLSALAIVPMLGLGVAFVVKKKEY